MFPWNDDAGAKESKNRLNSSGALWP